MHFPQHFPHIRHILWTTSATEEIWISVY